MWVNEIFQSFQGEGPSLGMPSVFLRTYGCNLACKWCDTPQTWNVVGSAFSHPDKHKRDDEKHKMSVSNITNTLRLFEERNLVITGGEPMLQQSELIELIRILKPGGWRIEIETNGTVILDEELLTMLDQINCSPKLTNSGPDNALEKRIRPKALQKLANSPKTNFKFAVVGFEDMREIITLVNDYDISSSQVYLMPEGRTRKEQLARQNEIRSLCREYGYNFSPRLHILMHDDKRGV